MECRDCREGIRVVLDGVGRAAGDSVCGIGVDSFGKYDIDLTQKERKR